MGAAHGKGRGRSCEQLKQKSFGEEGEDLKSREKESQEVRIGSSGQGNEEGRHDLRFAGWEDTISHFASMFRVNDPPNPPLPYTW